MKKIVSIKCIWIFFGIIEVIMIASLQWRLAILYCTGYFISLYAYFHIQKMCEMVLYLDKKNAIDYVKKQFVKRYVLYGISLFLVGMFSKSGFDILILAFGILTVKFSIQVFEFYYFSKSWLNMRKNKFTHFFDNEYLGNRREE